MILSVLTPRRASLEIVLTHACWITHAVKILIAILHRIVQFVVAYQVTKEIHMLGVIHMNVCKIQTVQLILHVRLRIVWNPVIAHRMLTASLKITEEYANAYLTLPEILMALPVYQ